MRQSIVALGAAALSNSLPAALVVNSSARSSTKSVARLLAASLGASVASASLPAGPDTEPRSVVAAEYAFAGAAKVLGVRGAFLKFLASDSILCTPLPVNGVESTAAGPATADALLWYPTYSHTARSADLGYTTGPWTFRSADGKSEAHGTFLSVWRRQPDGTWRVALDCGVSHPKLDTAPAALKAPTPAARSSGSTGAEPDAATVNEAPVPVAGNWKDPVAAAEARFTATAASERGPAAAFEQFAASDVRVMINGVVPAIGPVAGQALVAAQHLGSTWQHVFTSDSRDGMLGYAWGYIGDAQAPRPRAVYVNIWRKETPGAAWQIVAQSLQVIPAKSQ